MPPFAIEEENRAEFLFSEEIMNDAVSEDKGLGLPGSGPAMISLLNGGPGLEVSYDDGVSNSAPVANMGEYYGEAEDEDEDEDGIVATASEARNRSRLSSSAAPARTPSKRSTPASAPASASAPTTAGAGRGRKRKAAAVETEADPVPAKRRGRPPGPTSARLFAKAVKKETRGRPKRQQEVSTKPTSAAAKRGRPKKGETSGAAPAGEYEVEEILDSAIDADTMEHMYRVKWKGYPVGEATWEPKKNLTHAAILVRAFDATKKNLANGVADEGEGKQKKKPGRKAKARP